MVLSRPPAVGLAVVDLEKMCVWGWLSAWLCERMVGWHQRPDGHEFEQALGVGDGQGSLACCLSWGRKDLDTTERLI